MEKPAITRRTFLKASAIAGVAAAVVSPGMLTLKGLIQGRAAAPAEEKVFHSGCRACHTNCPVLVHVRDGRVIKIEGDSVRGGPPNFGRACLRAMGALQWLYSPTRIKYPLKRVGQRGEGKWQRLSWGQAMDEVAAQLKGIKAKYGAESIAFPGRTGRHDCNMIEARIAYTVGSPNINYGTGDVCYINRTAIRVCTFGEMAIADTASSAVRVNWGLDRSLCHTTLVQHDMDARFSRGQKVITIDPIFSTPASYSDIWIPVRPATDGALALAWMNVIISEKLYDAAFVKTWTNGPFLAKTDETAYKVATGTVKLKLGDLLTEADIKAGGSPRRYLFWNQPTNDLRYWDADEIQWQGGPSGKEYFDKLAKNCGVGKPFNKPPAQTDVSPASELPGGVDPALFGTYTVTLKDGTKAECKPVFQHLADIAAAYTPEKAAQICWSPDPERIRQAARMFATIKPASIDEGVPGDQHTNSTQIIRAQATLQMITGNVGNQGGYLPTHFYPVTPIVMPPRPVESLNDAKLPLEMQRKRTGYYDHAIFCGGAMEEDLKKLRPYPWHFVVPQAMVQAHGFDIHTGINTGKPYPVKAFVTVCANPLMHDANVNYLYEGMKKLEHHVAIDIVMTPTCEMADYVLPAVTWLERPYMDGTASTYAVRAFERAIQPLWEARHDWEFGYELGKRLGMEQEAWPEGPTQEDWYDFRCQRDLGVSWKEVLGKLTWTPPTPPPPKYYQHKISGKFSTYTGKAEIYSTIFKRWGYPPIPIYVEDGYSPFSQPEMAKKYPLILATGKRQPGWFHSEFRMVPWLREIVREPWLFITPKDAELLGIKDGDWVWIESPVGKCMNKAKVSEGLLLGVVINSQHAWWRPEKSAEEDMHGAFEWNIGCVIQDEYHDPECGGWPLKSQLCKVYKATAADIEKYKPEITLEQLQKLLPLKEV